MQRGSRDRNELAQVGCAMAGAVQQLPGDQLASGVIASVRQNATYLLKRDFHVRRRPVIHLDHERPSSMN